VPAELQQIIFRGFISHSLSKNIIIHECLLSFTVNNTKPNLHERHIQDMFWSIPGLISCTGVHVACWVKLQYRLCLSIDHDHVYHCSRML